MQNLVEILSATFEVMVKNDNWLTLFLETVYLPDDLPGLVSPDDDALVVLYCVLHGLLFLYFYFFSIIAVHCAILHSVDSVDFIVFTCLVVLL